MSHDRQELLESLDEQMASIVRRLRYGFRFSEFKLGASQARVLFFIAEQKEDMTVKDLAGMLGVTSGAASQFVDALVDKDLVRREEDARDRRLIRVKLTELAKSKLEEFRKGYLASASRVFDVLSDAEIKELVRLLDKVDAHAVPATV